MNEIFKSTRRDFLRLGTLAGAGLVIGIRLGRTTAAAAEGGARPLAPNAFLSIDATGQVTIWVARTELGQGVRTSLPMLVAEELDADWSLIRIVQADAHPTKYGPMTTGGSTSIRQSFLPLRKAGAAAREMLLDAAAKTWQVERATCRADNGAVLHVPTGRRLKYGELAEAAAALPVPADPPLRDPKDFRFIGRGRPRLDVPAKVDGSARFGLDLRIPGQRFAAIARSPVIGGKAKSVEDGAAKAVRGVRQVVTVPTGVAVVADSTWAAFQGRDALKVIWDEGPNATLDGAGIRRMFEEKARGEAVVGRADGDVTQALAGAARRLEAVYELPFQAHVPMEPPNCIAHVLPDRCEVWAPVQTPQWLQGQAAQSLGLKPEQVIVHVALSGGGFGRRLLFDYALEAIEVSRAAGGPVQVVWSREDDVRHSNYRPASRHHLAAGLDGEDRLGAFSHRLTGPSISNQLFGAPIQPKDFDAMEGAADFPYRLDNFRFDFVLANTPVPVTWWRSVYHSQNPFAQESFLDEVAAAAKQAPFEFRRRLLPEGSRLRRVLELAAAKAGWGKTLPAGHGRGIACQACYDSYNAQVAEVSVDQEGKLRVHRVVTAVDCGIAVNPDAVVAQMEGVVAFALSAVLKDAITLQNGRVEQGNYDDFRIIRMDEMPAVEVVLVPSTESPGGIGEVGVAALAPAVANAIFAATGRRLRRLPIRPADLRG